MRATTAHAVLLWMLAGAAAAAPAPARPRPAQALETLDVKDLTGVSVEFLKDASGRVDRLAPHGDSSTVGPRKR